MHVNFAFFAFLCHVCFHRSALALCLLQPHFTFPFVHNSTFGQSGDSIGQHGNVTQTPTGPTGYILIRIPAKRKTTTRHKYSTGSTHTMFWILIAPPLLKCHGRDSRHPGGCRVSTLEVRYHKAALWLCGVACYFQYVVEKVDCGLETNIIFHISNFLLLSSFSISPCHQQYSKKRESPSSRIVDWLEAMSWYSKISG